MITSVISVYTTHENRNKIEKASEFLGLSLSEFVLQAAEAETDEATRMLRLSKLWKGRFKRQEKADKTPEQRDKDKIEKMQEKSWYIDQVTLALVQKAMEMRESLRVAAARLHIPFQIIRRYFLPDGRLTELGVSISESPNE